MGYTMYMSVKGALLCVCDLLLPPSSHQPECDQTTRYGATTGAESSGIFREAAGHCQEAGTELLSTEQGTSPHQTGVHVRIT